MSRIRALRALALLTGVFFLAHAALQGVGAATFWEPCFDLGYTSAQCSYLQYEAPTPLWAAVPWVWLLEMAAVLGVVWLAVAARARPGLAIAATVAVGLSNMVTDYVLTPVFNGGFSSADNAPGFGLFGAVLLAAGGVLLLTVAVLPARVPRTGRDVSTPVSAEARRLA